MPDVSPDPRYPETEWMQPGNEDEFLGTASLIGGAAASVGPIFFDAPSELANNITAAVNAYVVNTSVCSTDVWQVVWEPNLTKFDTESGFSGDSSRRLTATFALVCQKGEIWQGIGGPPNVSTTM